MNEFVVFRHFLVVGHTIKRDGCAEGEGKLNRSQNGLLGSALRNVQNVAGQQLQILGLTVLNFLQIEGDFVLLTRASLRMTTA